MGPEGISFRPRSTPPPPLGTLTELRIEGMDCGNCARSVTEALQGVAGVSRAVAGKAMFRENRTNLSVEIHARFRRGCGSGLEGHGT